MKFDGSGHDALPTPTSYVPALDGLRALAILAVMGTHFDVPYSEGGQLGVDVFFVLSGFLITNLIVVEHRRTGTVWWKGFFARRALRLLPALWVASAGTVVMVYLSRHTVTGDVLVRNGKPAVADIMSNTLAEVGIAIGYVADIPQVFGVRDVFFGHTWSLSVEEQFYLLLPLLWVVVLRRLPARSQWIALLVLALGLAALRIGGHFGPFGLIGSRVDALFLGSCFAVVRFDPRFASVIGTMARLLVLPSTAGLITLMTIIGPDLATLTGRAQSWVASVCAALVVTSVWEGSAGVLTRVLSLRPFTAIGRISYGLYLCHLPIARRIAYLELDWPGPAVVALEGRTQFRRCDRELCARREARPPKEGPIPCAHANVGAASASQSLAWSHRHVRHRHVRLRRQRRHAARSGVGQPCRAPSSRRDGARPARRSRRRPAVPTPVERRGPDRGPLHRRARGGPALRAAPGPPPRAALFRLLAPELLPRNTVTALYLDCDIIVTDALDTIPGPSEGTAIAAARDALRPWVGGEPAIPWREVNCPPSAPYFNSGVMVMNLPAWTEIDVTGRSLQLLQSHSLPFADQCALNLVVGGDWTELGPRWNLQTTHQIGDQSPAWITQPRGELESALTGPAVVHYTGPKKPWTTGPGPRFRTEWFEHLERTPWAGWRPAAAPTSDRVRRRIERALPFSRG